MKLTDEHFGFLSNSSLSLVRLGVDFVLPLSQEKQQEEQEEQPPPKSTRRKCTADLKFGTKTYLTKLRPGEVTWMVSHHPQGDPKSKIYQQELYYRLNICQLDFAHKIKTR